MKDLRTDTRLQLCISPLYSINDNSVLKLCYLNARSLHKHIEDVRKDFNYSSTDIEIFTETRFTPTDPDAMYKLNVQLISDYTTDNKTIIDHIFCKTTSQQIAMTDIAQYSY